MRTGTNVGAADRVVRVIAGVSLLVFSAAGLFPGMWRVLLSLTGAAVAFTGISGHCPIYRLLRLSGAPRRN